MTALHESLKEPKLAMVTKTAVDQWWSEGCMGRNYGTDRKEGGGNSSEVTEMFYIVAWGGNYTREYICQN